MLKKYQQQFLTYPAATRNHHDYVSGLADHVVSMLKLGKALIEIYPGLNKDLLYAGIILHDIGKINIPEEVLKKLDTIVSSAW